MNVVVTKSYEASCKAAADMIAKAIQANPAAKLGLATGSTPLPIYKELIRMHTQEGLDFSQVRTVNLDEYCGIDASHPQSYRYFMNENLFNHVNIDKKNTYVPSGMGNLEQNAAELEAKVFEGGTPAVQLLGIGSNGHVGFNEAGSRLTAQSHVEPLVETTINDNARFFEKREDVPTQAVSMGMKGILAAQSIVLVATGASKVEAIRGLVQDDCVYPQNPATFLKLHPNATIIIDEELAKQAGYKA